MKFRDYYEVMGVPRTATAEQIKNAYRRLARKYHPDVSKEAGAEDKFKAVNEAYEALRDPQKRAAYDQLRAQGYRPGEDIRPPPGGFGGYGSFHRRFALPDSADPDGIQAHGRNGVLEISIPKRPETTPRRIQVQ